MSDQVKTSIFRWAQFIVGVFAFAALLYVHTYIKDLPAWLIAMPALLLGVDPSKIWGGGKK